MAPFSTFSLKSKITAMIVAASCVVLALSSSFFVASEIVTQKRLMVGELRAVAGIIAANVTAAVLFEDWASARETLSSLRAKPGIVAARIHTRDGTLFAEFRRDPAAPDQRQPPDPQMVRADAAESQEAGPDYRFDLFAGYIDLHAPIELDGERLGTVALRSNLDQLHDTVDTYAVLGALVAVVLILIAYVMAARLQSVISGPILRLLDTMQAVSSGQDYSLRAVKTGDDELGSLTDGFNAMLARIEAHDAELRSAWHQAEAASRTKSEFLANMSHELRTPLNAIIGFSEVLKSEMLGPLGSTRYQAYADDIFDSGHHLLDVISDILDISKVEAGEFELDEQPTALPELIDQAVTLVRERAENAGLELTVDSGPALPAVLVDARLIKQSLINLLSNAVKFSLEPGRIAVRAAQEPDGAVLMSVADTGIGIPEPDLERILQPFAQVESAFSRSHEGTGLGLPLAKSFIEAHGGTLHIQSRLGEGTTVTLRLPPERVGAAPKRAAAASARQSSSR